MFNMDDLRIFLEFFPSSEDISFYESLTLEEKKDLRTHMITMAGQAMERWIDWKKKEKKDEAET